MKKEELDKFAVPLSVDRIIQILSAYLEIINPKIEELKKVKLKMFEYFLLSTLVRMSVNVSALIVLFPKFKEDRTFKLPINLILRSIVSDYLTIAYLLTFKDPNDATNVAIINEIKVLDLDFVKFQQAMLIEELTYLQEKEGDLWPQERMTERLNKFYNDNLDSFIEKNQEFVPKPRSSFRSTTPNSILEEGDVRNSKILDSDKFKRLKSFGLIDFTTPAYLPFKYFSQFQHPCSNMDELLMSKPIIIDNRMILMALDLLFVGSIQIFRNIINDEDLDLQIKKLQEDILDLVKK